MEDGVSRTDGIAQKQIIPGHDDLQLPMVDRYYSLLGKGDRVGTSAKVDEDELSLGDLITIADPLDDARWQSPARAWRAVD